VCEESAIRNQEIHCFDVNDQPVSSISCHSANESRRSGAIRNMADEISEKTSLSESQLFSSSYHVETRHIPRGQNKFCCFFALMCSSSGDVKWYSQVSGKEQTRSMEIFNNKNIYLFRVNQMMLERTDDENEPSDDVLFIVFDKQKILAYGYEIVLLPHKR
jgi:hypothetical protein